MCFVCGALSGCGRPTLESHGGYLLTYHLTRGQKDANHEQMAQAMQQRLRHAGFRYAVVRVTKNDEFAVALPTADKADAERAEQRLAVHGHLEMRILAERGKDDALIEAALAADVSDGASEASFRWVSFDEDAQPADDSMVFRDTASADREILALVGESDVFSSDFATVNEGLDETMRPCLEGSMSELGSLKTAALTSGNLNRRLAIIIDDRLVSAPTIQSEISSRFQITGNFSEDEIQAIVGALKAGEFPARLEKTPASIEKIDPE